MYVRTRSACLLVAVASPSTIGRHCPARTHTRARPNSQCRDPFVRARADIMMRRSVYPAYVCYERRSRNQRTSPRSVYPASVCTSASMCPSEMRASVQYAARRECVCVCVWEFASRWSRAVVNGVSLWWNGSRQDWIAKAAIERDSTMNGCGPPLETRFPQILETCRPTEDVAERLDLISDGYNLAEWSIRPNPWSGVVARSKFDSWRKYRER